MMVDKVVCERWNVKEGVGKMVFDQGVTGWRRRREEEEKEEDRDTESKRRTPHKVVGKNEQPGEAPWILEETWLVNHGLLIQFNLHFSFHRSHLDLTCHSFHVMRSLFFCQLRLEYAAIVYGPTF